MIKIRPKAAFSYCYKDKKIIFTPNQVWMAFIDSNKIVQEVTLVHDGITITMPITDYYEKFKRLKDGSNNN